jgi:hypothetical protein
MTSYPVIALYRYTLRVWLNGSRAQYKATAYWDNTGPYPSEPKMRYLEIVAPNQSTLAFYLASLIKPEDSRFVKLPPKMDVYAGVVVVEVMPHLRNQLMGQWNSVTQTLAILEEWNE